MSIVAKQSEPADATELLPDPASEPLVVRPRIAKKMLGDCGDEELYRKIKNGEVDSYLDGRRRLVTVASIKADIARRVAAAQEHGFQRARGADHDGLGRPPKPALPSPKDTRRSRRRANRKC